MAVNKERSDNIKTPVTGQSILMESMMHLNFWILAFVLFIVSRSTSGMIHERSALSFLTQTEAIPAMPVNTIILISILYLCLILLLSITDEKGTNLVFKLCLETITVIWISELTGFSYTGMFLMVFADLMRNQMSRRDRTIAIIALGVFYLVLDSSVLNFWLRRISIDDYLIYYSADYAGLIKGVLKIGSLLNTFLFILFMLYQIRKHMNENERIMMLNESLKEANIKLEEYSKSSALMAQTAERNRLAREIHDTIGHALTGIVTGLDACLMMFDKDRDLVKTQLGAIAEVARNGMTDVRQSVKALRPDALEKLPLDEAIEKLIDEMGRSTGVNIDYHCHDKLSDAFDETEEETIYRTIQESITNAISHGNASNINIEIKRSEDNMLTIEIKDNGSGSIDFEKGFGLTHMEERLNMLGGSLYIDGSDGFTVRAQMPIRWGAREN